MSAAHTTDLVSPREAFVQNGVFTDLGHSQMISVGSRTGTKVHAARPSSSQTACGRWLKFQSIAYRRFEPVNCENCISMGYGEEDSK